MFYAIALLKPLEQLLCDVVLLYQIPAIVFYHFEQAK